ncbi:DUF982 domain-containing protein [Neorhizobium sp. NCHU2750]|uniref:DUF982 domain-containing protein n=1 Tax=Neorhizobium sp. NCHU2750 TaxID=1825976 RepID=UPI0013C48DAF
MAVEAEPGMGDRKRWTVDLSVVDPTWANWEAPVILRRGTLRQEIIENPAEALAFLHHCWPSIRTVQAEEAIRLCSQVLRRRVPTESARLAFVAAVAEAKILQ